MRRLDFLWMRRLAATAVAVVGSIVMMAMAPTGAMAASLAPGVGFDLSTLPGVDLVIDGDTPIYEANEPPAMGSVDVELSGSLDLCILVAASTTCQPTVNIGTAAPVSFLVTYTVEAINTPGLSSTEPFTLLLSDLNASLGYPRDNVTVDLTPAAIPGLVTTGVPGFDFNPLNGVNGFTPFVVIQDDFFGTGNEQYYIGWTVMMGDSVTFKFDLEAGTVLNFVPGFTANAIPEVVPEPGTALLMGLGLAALSRTTRRKV